MARRIATTVVLAATLLGASAVPADAAQRQGKRASAAALVRFDSCRQLTRFARANIVRTGGGTGVPFRGEVVAPAPLREPGFVRRTGGPEPIPAPAATTDAGGSGAEAGFSTTNVQEAGVDEPDIVKTDGRRLYAVAAGVLRIFDVTGAAPRPLGRLALDGAEHQLLVRGERLLVLATAATLPPRVPGGPSTTAIAPAPAPAKMLLAEVDVRDPAAPRVARTMELAGRLAGARLTRGTARIVVASTPQPIAASSRAQLRRRARAASTRRFLPRTTIRSRISGRTFRRAVAPCERVHHPRRFSGLDLLSVLTVDLDQGLYAVGRQAVMAGAQDVYASPSSLVVASRRFSPGTPGGTELAGGTTELHVFDAGGEPQTTYRASGSVPGFVLNQFSMSEHEGALRVATTEDAPFDPATRAQPSQSGVSVLRPSGGRLVAVGRVTGLGRGERIFGVRFLGDRGYVVTFRQTDPLYSLDLSDPASPRVTGELKVTGYSAYLHPISDRLLLGVGQEATEQGVRLGPQVSLFDVGDPARPRLVGRAALGGSGSSAAEQDHHAFLWWAPARLAVLPLDTYELAEDGSDRSFSGAVGFRVGDDGVAEVGRIAHPPPSADRYAPPIGRSVVVGDRLLTLSASGIATNALADLAPLAFTPLDG